LNQIHHAFGDVQRLDKVPMLGTGKIDYKALRALIHESQQLQRFSMDVS
jgi:acyl-coenzyme A synthetase/AMP-(fatty) acid ligase